MPKRLHSVAAAGFACTPLFASPATLYLSDSHATAIAEYQQNLPRPGTLTAYEVDGTAILDLADPAMRHSLGVDDAFLRQPWEHVRDIERQRPSCWDFAATKAGAGWHGLRVPSVQAPGTNLVLWRWTGVESLSSGTSVRSGICHATSHPGDLRITVTIRTGTIRYTQVEPGADDDASVLP